ncbi:hypothetical protein [Demequina litorisediminis]|uniref:Phage protein, HK97 gp10 family n=1 Tax=Demequina litorisediminis TaxID=1849022 RepID=A0ABQ6IBV1_9MICO|nr:hypothetical protein [Demequina litorisediminis]GMA34741.1 hypothetical protein GCM10025876_09450 [Demequina litorisediminis]
MAADDFTITSGDVRLRVEGLGRTLRDMSKAGADAEDMKDLMHSLGLLVVNASQPPTDSGTLATTLRAGRGKTKAVVRAGGARAKYAGVIHYGWPARNIEPQPFLSDALNKTRPQILKALNDGLGDLLKKHDLT